MSTKKTKKSDTTTTRPTDKATQKDNPVVEPKIAPKEGGAKVGLSEPDQNTALEATSPAEMGGNEPSTESVAETGRDNSFRFRLANFGIKVAEGDATWIGDSAEAEEVLVLEQGHAIGAFREFRTKNLEKRQVPIGSTLWKANRCVCAIYPWCQCEAPGTAVVIADSCDETEFAVADKVLMLSKSDPAEFDQQLNRGLAAYLSSSLLDGWVRITFGSDTLTPAMLRSLPCPNREGLYAIADYLDTIIGGSTGRNRSVKLSDIDDAVRSILFDD